MSRRSTSRWSGRRLKRALVALRERLVAIYENGTPDMLSVIVGADGYDELIDRTEYLERIHGMDEAVVDRVRQLRDQVQANRLAAALGEAADRSRPATRSPPNARRSPTPARRCSSASRSWSRRGATARPRSRRSTTTSRTSRATVAEIQAEIAAQLGGLARRRCRRARSGYGSGQLIWPVDGPVVSGFGMRWGRMHEGIDIAVPAGTPIRAADAGTVVLLQSEAESGGYGNFTCLDHGGGLQTCYAHQSSFAVSAGQSVSQGQVIGYIGCTGHCFGPHLHFEVRVGGVPTDPLGYL